MGPEGFGLFTTHDTDESLSKLVFPGMQLVRVD